MNYLLDTNVLSELRRPLPDRRVVSWLEHVDEDRVFLSVISIAEVARGLQLLEPGRRRDALAQWLEHDLVDRFASRLLLVDTSAAMIWGRLMADAKRLGRGLSVMDGWIAAIAVSRDLILVTRNQKDFEGLGMSLFDPWSDDPRG